MTGGTTAPAPTPRRRRAGIGQAMGMSSQMRKPRMRDGGTPVPAGLSAEIGQAQAEVAPTAAPGAPVAQRSLGSRRAGVQQGFQAGLGKQLSRRVSSGAIDQGQAEKVDQQRQLLERAFGPNWRVKVFGAQGLVARNRVQAAKGSTDPNVAALQKKLMEDRNQALSRAQAKVG